METSSLEEILSACAPRFDGYAYAARLEDPADEN
jgi:hypothetical protein